MPETQSSDMETGYRSPAPRVQTMQTSAADLTVPGAFMALIGLTLIIGMAITVSRAPPATGTYYDETHHYHGR